MSTMVNPQLHELAVASVSRMQRELAKTAGDKVAFVPGGDPAMDPMAAGGGAMDPAAGGMDPAAGGMDPSMAAGGAAPPPPVPAPPTTLQPAVSPVEPIKPKIDPNVTMLQILKILARIADALHVPIPASEMVATQGDLTQMGMQQGSGGMAGGQASAIPPIQPIQPAGPGMDAGKTAMVEMGMGFDAVGALGVSQGKAAAVLDFWKSKARGRA